MFELKEQSNLTLEMYVYLVKRFLCLDNYIMNQLFNWQVLGFVLEIVCGLFRYT